MGQVTDLLYTALVSIQSDSKLILDFNFMMNIFADLKHELQEFDTYSTWFYHKKEGSNQVTQHQGESVAGGSRYSNALLPTRGTE